MVWKVDSVLVEHGFQRGSIDKTLFIQQNKQNILIAQVYVDDIVFGSTSESLFDKFAKKMSSEFEMSMVGELSFFLGLQVKQTSSGIFVSQPKYAQDLLKKFGMMSSKH